MHSDRHDSTSQRVESEDWDSIAHALITFDIQLETNGSAGKRLRKELGVVKHLLYEHIKARAASGELNLSFFVGAVKSIRSLEKRYEANHESRREFLLFLKLVMEKLKKQRLHVKKPMEMRAEFGRMKEVVEHGPSPV